MGKGTHSYNGVLSFGFGGTNACATCWGPNKMTSLGSIKGSKDIHATVLNRIKNATSPEVTITSDDWEDWEMDYPGRYKREGESWDVTIEEDGELMYSKRRIDKITDLGSTFELTGSFNDWGFESLEADESTPGLFTTVIEIGGDGEETFQVVADEDVDRTFYPKEENCTRKSCEVLGPGASQQENSWCIKGNDGDRFRVEFYRSMENAVSISWIKETW